MPALDRRWVSRVAGLFALPLILLPTVAEAQQRAAKEMIPLNEFRRGGSIPGGRLLLGQDGALYGVLLSGGIANQGVIFKLTQVPGQRRWKRTKLYKFKGGDDGELPLGGLTADPDGVLYGTTCLGGLYGGGVFYSLTPPPQGETRWKRKTLHAFNSAIDGFCPLGDLLFGPDGALYGVNRGQRVFKLARRPGRPSAWKLSVLHVFLSDDLPNAGLIFGPEGELYGAADEVNIFGGGIVFMLTPPAGGGAWTRTVLHDFQGGPDDGTRPQAGVIMADGALYGTTRGGGASSTGTVFRLTPPVGQDDGVPWTFTLLHSFTGFNPSGGLIRGGDGTFYGTTAGSLFELTPPALPGGDWTIAAVQSQVGSPRYSLIADQKGTLWRRGRRCLIRHGCGVSIHAVRELAGPSSSCP